MKIGVLGTGVAGQTVGGKLVEMGHDVMMGARAADNEKVVGFAQRTGGRAGTFADAAAHGEIVLNCTRGDTSLATLGKLASELSGKILIDVANPLDFSQGYPPHLTVSNTDSLAEQIQRALPQTLVVKSLNTVNASVMIDPSRVPGRHTVFVSGNDKHAKGRVSDLLRSLGWQSIIDLGDISSARAAEQLLPLWVRLYTVLGNTGDFNIAVMKADNGI
ncbi:MAG: NAD(P)-binding domain-containing protein [Devosia sp.]|uniref:NADPH-dependent F420 reductase n=1 Tax=Devosia sp. 66-22 TaxID=1895753 RepID=UPI0009299FE7|nr:NAD(P)-binding domain-containing protein [Devosia sp. 66-22]MBN9348892.1 NAD(P)-binding domain-containing protein [Devosia sp.]OJX51627.1 MAG: NADP oxidoreductase [Devosia sp. 66-22]